MHGNVKLLKHSLEHWSLAWRHSLVRLGHKNHLVRVGQTLCSDLKYRLFLPKTECVIKVLLKISSGFTQTNI